MRRPKAELRSATLVPHILQEAHAARHPAHATIVIGLVLAFCGGFVARKLRLPPLVGYLLAGVAVGPVVVACAGRKINIHQKRLPLGAS